MKSFTFLFLLIEWLIFLSVSKVFVKILARFVKIVVMKLTFFVIIVQAFTDDKIKKYAYEIRTFAENGLHYSRKLP